MTSIRRKRWFRSFKNFLASKIFEVKRKGVRDDVFNIKYFFQKYIDDKGESYLTAGQLGQLKLVLVICQLTVGEIVMYMFVMMNISLGDS